MRGMRTARRVGVCLVVGVIAGLVIGAIATVGVAWGATALPFRWGESVDVVPSRVARASWSQYGSSAPIENCERSKRPGVTRTIVSAGRPGGSVVILESGWPLRAVSGCAFGDGAGGVEYRGVHQVSRYRFFPVSIISPGFLLDTLFYSAFAWLLWFGAVSLVRARRRRRGFCPRCKYPIGANRRSPRFVGCIGPARVHVRSSPNWTGSASRRRAAAGGIPRS